MAFGPQICSPQISHRSAVMARKILVRSLPVRWSAGLQTDHLACIKASKAASSLNEQAKCSFEEKLAMNIKENHKSFLAYVRSKSKINVRVGALVTQVVSYSHKPG